MPEVAVAQEFVPVDAEDLAGLLQLGGAHLGQPRPNGCLVHVVDLALLAARGGDEHHAADRPDGRGG